MRKSVLWLAALAALCSQSVGHASNPAVADEVDVPSAAVERLGAAIRGHYQSVPALTAAIEGWVDQASPEDTRAAIVGSGDKDTMDWPPLLPALVMTPHKSRSDSAALLLLANDLVARYPETLTDGRWQAGLALLAARSGDLKSAHAAAVKARELGVLACGERCDSTYLKWLDSGAVPAVPTLEASAVYDPRGSDCRSSEGGEQWMLREVLSIDPALLVREAHGPQAELTWRLAHYWQAALSACPDPELWTLRGVIDDSTPALVVEQSWHEAQSRLAGGVPTTLRFLGVDLPLPARECDFAADASCQGEGQKLGAQSANTLVQQLRAVSRHLDAPGRCPAPPSDEQKLANQSLQKSFEIELTAWGDTPALAVVLATLEDPRWQPLMRSGVQYELRAQLIAAAIGPRASEVYQAVEAWARSAPVETSELTSTQDLLARIALRAGRSDAALSHLTRAQATDPSIERAKTIGLLRAAIAGADLRDRASPPLPTRPWTYGLDNLELLTSWDRATLLTDQSEIGAGEIVLGVRGPEAALAFELGALWPALLWGAEPMAPKVSAWLDEVYGSERLAQLRAQAEASIDLEGDPSMQFAGIRYPLPDRFCDTEDCETPVATTRERVIQGLARSGVLAQPRTQ